MQTTTLVLVAAGLLLAAEAKEDAKKEQERFQGTWTIVSLENQGMKVADDAIKDWKLTIKDDQWIVSQGDRELKATFKLDPTKDPKQIDLAIKNGDQEVLAKGIYKLENDTLTMCRTAGQKERPKEFKTSEEAGVLVVWKRTGK